MQLLQRHEKQDLQGYYQKFCLPDMCFQMGLSNDPLYTDLLQNFRIGINKFHGILTALILVYYCKLCTQFLRANVQQSFTSRQSPQLGGYAGLTMHMFLLTIRRFEPRQARARKIARTPRKHSRGQSGQNFFFSFDNALLLQMLRLGQLAGEHKILKYRVLKTYVPHSEKQD